MDRMEYRAVLPEELCVELFRGFERRQVVNDCWRKVDGQWKILSDPFVDQWSHEDYAFLVDCLKNTLRTGGAVYGAFADGVLKGFASVEAGPMGGRGQYRDLSSIHVSQEMRGKGVGRVLFRMAARWAGEQGADKLYISAHSAVETQAFYRAMGCVEAEEYDAVHTEREPFDCQLEFLLSEENFKKT